MSETTENERETKAMLEANLLTSDQLAERIGVAPGTVRQWRMRGEGPPFIKHTKKANGMVRYRLADVVEWEKSLVRSSTIAP